MSVVSSLLRFATNCSTSTGPQCRTAARALAFYVRRRQTVTIKLRPGVKFHDGEPFNAEAAKFSLERHASMTGSFRKPELAAVDHVDVVDPLTINVVLKNSLLAVDRAVH